MKQAVREALEQILAEDDAGVLRPEVIVERAKARSSPLHDFFTWDDTRAAHAWRVNEARDLIRSYSVVIQQQPPIKTRAFVSLKSVRAKGGGYLPLARVMSDRELHAEMLRDALDDLEWWRKRYEKLQELQPIFAAARRVRRRVTRKKVEHHAAA